ncbi:NAD(P)-dependent oxidoreductase, partial [Peribacillus acanthi]|uniref:NAD(P)-dependent oxidoreductase n=1 Tax=Peribacillus acanthi TaxID=2171554 RepID=UPI001F0B7D66
MDNQKNKIGFIGTGVMGKSMVRNLMKAGFPVSVYSRTKEKAIELLNEGAIWSSSPKELAQNMDVIISIVGYPSDVEEIYLGEDGIIHNGKPGLTAIDMTTSKPSLAVKIYDEAKTKGIFSLDAPVSGGDVG